MLIRAAGCHEVVSEFDVLRGRTLARNRTSSSFHKNWGSAELLLSCNVRRQKVLRLPGNFWITTIPQFLQERKGGSVFALFQFNVRELKLVTLGAGAQRDGTAHGSFGTAKFAMTQPSRCSESICVGESGVKANASLCCWFLKICAALPRWQ